MYIGVALVEGLPVIALVFAIIFWGQA
jgi:F0F1-type ATP synthase membrane subunit c/vacuolar-type H+-ATPase subunit K